MAKNNLAGLAALGALGMMMSKGKKTEVEDRFGSGAGTPYDMRDMRGGAEDERPAPTGMGEATELLSDRGENFSNEGRSGYVQPPVKMPSKARATAPSSRSTISIDDEAGMSRGMRNRAGAGRGVTMPTQPQVDSTTEEGMRNYVSRAPSGMKKGGVVKMAKGGMTSSASSRGDGIASKGKTRGKIC